MQLQLPDASPRLLTAPLKGQLLKWIGNKQRFAGEIVRAFPEEFGAYHEPFLGSGAVLATFAPRAGFASDTFAPLMQIWTTLKDDPEAVKEWYRTRLEWFRTKDRGDVYEEIKASYNRHPNGADLLFLCRSCYGGVVRFRKTDGYMSTPLGPHTPISAESFSRRADDWSQRLQGTTLTHESFESAFQKAQPHDLIYCDPPYSHSQSILYGAQSFSLVALFEAIAKCKERHVYIVLSIDGSKKSGDVSCALPIPEGLFERELLIDCGRSMLRRFQMIGKTLEAERVHDRLLLTF